MAKGTPLLCVAVATAFALPDAYAQASNAAITLEEVVVTASRRPASEIDIAASVSSVGGQYLERNGIQQVMDLDRAITGLTMGKVGGNTVPNIRGVSTDVAGIGADANVAMYVDGVYQPLSQGNDFRFLDLERVEVLKGPQGTLYGRNATGGAILFVTKDPSLDEIGGKIVAGYGNHNTRSVRGIIDGPLAEGLAASLSASIRESDGYVRDLVRGGKANPSESEQIRGKLLWTPNDRWKAVLTAEYAEVFDPTSFAGTALGGNTVGTLYGGTPQATRPHTSSMDVEVFAKNKRVGGSLRIEGDLEIGQFSSTTSYFDYDNTFAVDADYSAMPVATYLGNHNHAEAVQQDIVLVSSNDGNLRWMVGGSFYQMENELSLEIPYGPVSFIILQALEVEAASAFAELSYDLTEKLSATVGVRYSTERHVLEDVRGINIPTNTALSEMGRERWNDVTPSASLQYAVSDTTNLYASYAKGFKSGVFDGTTFSPIDQENIDGYEVGIKSFVLPNLNFKAAAFYYDYRDQQVQSFVMLAGAPSSILQNAGESEIYGLDSEINWQLHPNFSVSAGLSVIHARFKEFSNAVVNVPTGSGGNVTTTIDASDNALSRSPDWTLSLGGSYSRDFSFGEVSVQGTVYHSDDIYFEFGNRVRQPAYTTVDLNMSLRPAGTGFEIQLYGRNLGDRRYISSTYITETVDGVTYAPPRQFGIDVSYAF